MPDSSNSSGTPPETAQASLLRLTRRHSLPASTTFSTFLSLWSAENANRENRERSNSSTANDVHPGIANNTSSNNRHHRSASISGDTLLNGSSNGNGALGGNRHRYGHRHTRSAVVDTPVIVKSYNPGPAVSRNASPLHENDDIEDIALPSIDSFSFDGILKAIDPAVTTALDSVGKLCEEYQTSLRTEVDALTDAQAEIDLMIKEADKLTSQAFKTTKMRTERLDAEAVGLKGGSTADALAAAAEATHTSLTSIITTLLAIDEMLPVQERLSPLSSAHKKHYPRLHTLLADKAHEIEVRFRNVRSPEMRPVSRPLSVQALMSRLDLDLGESSSSRTTMDPSSSWSPRRRLSTSSTLLLSSPTVSRASTSYNHNRGVSSPHLQLRTILPSPSNEQISASGSYFPIAPKTATGVSLTSPMYTAQQHLEGSISPRPMSPLMSPRRPSGMWSRRASSGTLAAFMARETDNSALYPSPPSGNDKDGGGTSPVGSIPTDSKPPSTWRHSAGSWAGFFGGRSSKGSSELSKGVSAEERLKMLLQAAGDGNSSSSSSKKKGKGKGVQR